MSSEEKIKQIIAIHERNLSLLEQQKVNTGPPIPVHLVNAIKQEQTEIAKLQAELEELQSGEVRKLPEDVYVVYLKAKQDLKDLRQKLESLPAELDDLAGSAKAEATLLLDYTRQQMLPLEKSWEQLNAKAEITKYDVEFFSKKVAEAGLFLSVLFRRQIYRNNLKHWQEQGGGQQIALTEQAIREIDLELESGVNSKQIKAIDFYYQASDTTKPELKKPWWKFW